MSGYDGKKVFCEVADNNVVEDSKENFEIGLWGFDFYLFHANKGRGGNRSVEWLSLFISINGDMD